MPEETRITLQDDTALLLALIAQFRGCDVDALVARLVRREAKRLCGVKIVRPPRPPRPIDIADRRGF
ncbi:MAG: hypothetical protein H6883_07145 [Rhodobiaceae bacterium]|nr:hypothetical protein [Rhodobiaceae bacterium]MCC0055895.1 hypothetical protein [Rhodobiaceae bacterium]